MPDPGRQGGSSDPGGLGGPAGGRDGGSPSPGEVLPGLAEVLADERFAPRSRPGQVAGHRLLGEVGRGGMGVVYRALQPCPRREVALKLVRPSRVCPRSWRRLQREIELHGRLSHPGIVTVLQAGVLPDGAPWLTMELVDGCCLSDHLREQRPDLERRLDLGAQVIDALVHAHERGVVHGDLSPANVLVDRAGRARVIDFGLARALGPAGRGVAPGGSPELAGTLPFLAPEQATPGGGPVDERTDVHGLGALLYLLLCDRPPLDLEALPRRAALERLTRGDPPPPTRWNPAVSPALERVVLRALRRDPERRFPSVRALARALAACPGSPGRFGQRSRPGRVAGGRGTGASRRRAAARRRAGPATVLARRLVATLGVLLGLAGGGLLTGARDSAADRELSFHDRHGLGQVGASERDRHLAWAARRWQDEPDRRARCLMTLGQDLERQGASDQARALWVRADALLGGRDDPWSLALAGSLARSLAGLDGGEPGPGGASGARPDRPRQASRPVLAGGAGAGAGDHIRPAGADRTLVAGDGPPTVERPRPGTAAADPRVGATSSGRPSPDGAALLRERPVAHPRLQPAPAGPAQVGSPGLSPARRRALRPVSTARGVVAPRAAVDPGDGLQLVRVLAASLLQQRAASGRGPRPEVLAQQLAALATGDLAPEAVLVWALTGWTGPQGCPPVGGWSGNGSLGLVAGPAPTPAWSPTPAAP